VKNSQTVQASQYPATAKSYAKAYSTKQGTTISKGQVFQARVSTFHSGATEFFRFTFEDETETTDVACMMAQFHSVDNPKA
jgi:hypothetical protein